MAKHNKWITFRMYRGSMIRDGFNGSGFFGNDSHPTARTFKGRTLTEATRKMDKFIREAQVTGSFYLRPMIQD